MDQIKHYLNFWKIFTTKFKKKSSKITTTFAWIDHNNHDEGFIMRIEEDTEIDYTAIFCAIFGLLVIIVLFFYRLLLKNKKDPTGIRGSY